MGISTRAKVAAGAAALAVGTAAGTLGATPAQAAGPVSCSAYVCAEIYSASGQVSTILAYANIAFTGHFELTYNGNVVNSANTHYNKGAGVKFGAERFQVYTITAWVGPNGGPWSFAGAVTIS